MIRELKYLILWSFPPPNTTSRATFLCDTCQRSSDIHSFTCKLDIPPILVPRRRGTIVIVYPVFEFSKLCSFFSRCSTSLHFSSNLAATSASCASCKRAVATDAFSSSAACFATDMATKLLMASTNPKRLRHGRSPLPYTFYLSLEGLLSQEDSQLPSS